MKINKIILLGLFLTLSNILNSMEEPNVPKEELISEFHSSIENFDYDKVEQYLKKYDWLVNARFYDLLPLELAAFSPDKVEDEQALKMTKVLLEYGADSDELVRRARLPILLYAIQVNRPKVFKLLLEYGADPLKKFNFKGKKTDVIEYLGSELNTRGSDLRRYGLFLGLAVDALRKKYPDSFTLK